MHGPSVMPASFNPTASGTATADPTSVASGSAEALFGSVASGTALAVNGSTASGDAVAINGSVASGCSVAVNGSTASGGDCAPEHITPTPDIHKMKTAPHADSPTRAKAVGAGDAKSLAFTGSDAEGLAEIAGASGALGALLLALGSKGRRKNEAQ